MYEAEDKLSWVDENYLRRNSYRALFIDLNPFTTEEKCFF